MTILRSLNQFEFEAFGIWTSNALYLPNCVCLIGVLGWISTTGRALFGQWESVLRLDSFIENRPSLSSAEARESQTEDSGASSFR
jgi:hypothetical protein